VLTALGGVGGGDGGGDGDGDGDGDGNIGVMMVMRWTVVLLMIWRCQRVPSLAMAGAVVKM